MSWQVLTLLSVLFISISNLLQRVLLRDEKSNPAAYSIVFQILTGSMIALFGFLVSDMTFPNLFLYWPNLFVTSISYGVGALFLFKALKDIETSKFAVLFASRIVFTALASSLFLQQHLNERQILGTILILAAILLVSVKRKTFTFGKGDFFALIAAAGFGVGFTNDEYLLNHFNLYPYIFIAFILPVFFIAPMNISSLKYVKDFLQKTLLIKMLILCFVYALGAITIYTALQMSTNASQVAAVNLSTVVVTVLLAVIFLKERDNLVKKILGALLAFIGLLLVT